jgi:hypothetical protein
VLDKVSVLQHNEWDAILDVLPPDVNHLKDLRATISNSWHIDHLDALLQLHQVTALRGRDWDWWTVAINTLCIVTTFTNSYTPYGLVSHRFNWVLCKKGTPETSPTTRLKSDTGGSADQPPSAMGHLTTVATYAAHPAE